MGEWIMSPMDKNKPITFKNLERICRALECTPDNMISFDNEYVAKGENND
jgi:hypothetical protein